MFDSWYLAYILIQSLQYWWLHGFSIVISLISMRQRHTGQIGPERDSECEEFTDKESIYSDISYFNFFMTIGDMHGTSISI